MSERVAQSQSQSQSQTLMVKGKLNTLNKGILLYH